MFIRTRKLVASRMRTLDNVWVWIRSVCWSEWSRIVNMMLSVTVTKIFYFLPYGRSSCSTSLLLLFQIQYSKRFTTDTAFFESSFGSLYRRRSIVSLTLPTKVFLLQRKVTENYTSDVVISKHRLGEKIRNAPGFPVPELLVRGRRLLTWQMSVDFVGDPVEWNLRAK